MNSSNWLVSFVCSLLVLAGAPSAALAQNELSTRPIPIYWDPTDPVNRAESRVYAALIWEAEDTGSYAQLEGFTFTNPTPGARLAMFSDEIAVFERLYASRLSPPDWPGEPYTLLNLIEDDLAIRSQFRTYVLTGVIVPVAAESMAEYTHLTMALDAMTTQKQFTVDQVFQSDSGLVTLNLRGVQSLDIGAVDGQTASVDPAPAPVPPEQASDDFGCRLRWFISASHVSCMFGNDLYTYSEQQIDFDCDDFTDVTIWWLRNLHFLEGTQGQALLISWRCPNSKRTGHWMPYVHEAGKFYLIDPYTGKVFGPYGTFEQMADVAW